ncbi:MAG: Hydrogenase maturation protease [Actinomycetia bacterium]|nr:Hydrogenase maturation protease [Actinomycetes bacterium]
MSPRTLVAGIGNIFFGDDGFGVEVAQRLSREPLPEGVEVVDVGIRGVHLAYQLLDGYDLLVLVDAIARGLEPGTVTVIEPDVDALCAAADPTLIPVLDAHKLDPAALLVSARAMGAQAGRTLVVGCEPERVDEGIGLSARVELAVDRAVAVVLELVRPPQPEREMAAASEERK